MMYSVSCHRLYSGYKLQIWGQICLHNFKSNSFDHIDFNYLCNPLNTELIKSNIHRRKGVGDIEEVIKLHKSWLAASSNEKDELKSKLLTSALKIPNLSHSEIDHLDEYPIVVKEKTPIIKSGIDSFNLLPFDELVHKLNLQRTVNISNFTGIRSYYLIDQLASLEQALIKFAVSKLKKLKFTLISVPDIIPREIIELCGMETRGERNQVYCLDESKYNNLCLSGTAEMGIAFHLTNKTLKMNHLPMKIAAVSRCFRAEISQISEEKGIYRVHQFTKVEMFGVSSPTESDLLLNEFVQIQEDIFSSLGLSTRILDMPPHELGAQAARKYDIEAWMPGKEKWGELSSASNCTDYQSRRLGIQTDQSYPHTINGTASAIPRLLIALIETHQKKDGSIELPKVLEPFLGFRVINKCRAPSLTAFKTKQRFKIV